MLKRLNMSSRCTISVIMINIETLVQALLFLKKLRVEQVTFLGIQASYDNEPMS